MTREERAAFKKQAVDLHDNGFGKSTAEIARELNLPRSTVYEWLRPDYRKQLDARKVRAARSTQERRAIHTCPGCGLERMLSYEMRRLIERRRRTGFCPACCKLNPSTRWKRAKARRAAALAAELELEPLLTAREIRAWARATVAAMTKRERLAVASIDVPDEPDDGYVPRVQTGTPAGMTLADLLAEAAGPARSQSRGLRHLKGRDGNGSQPGRRSDVRSAA